MPTVFQAAFTNIGTSALRGQRMIVSSEEKKLLILGTRGVPAAHGGFETFAEQLALFLARRGWHVTVYCQETGSGPIHRDVWRGVHRVFVPVYGDTPAASIVYDWRVTHHAASEPGLILTLGYNTAVFGSWLRLRGRTNLINMDGIEWKRSKWPAPVKAWFWLNERLGCWLGNHLIADHPEIKKHLETRVSGDKITVIAYGSERVEQASAELLEPYGLEPGKYATLIARPEPENSILEIVRAFSRKPRGMKLAILGNYQPEIVAFHRAVKAAASEEVCFLGAIYDKSVLAALREHCAFYVHGHQVGGTNPSLVEALGAGNAVLAHDNRFNHWVAGGGALYFANEDDCANRLDRMIGNEEILGALGGFSRKRHEDRFRWSSILLAYEELFERFIFVDSDRAMPSSVPRMQRSSIREVVSEDARYTRQGHVTRHAL